MKSNAAAQAPVEAASTFTVARLVRGPIFVPTDRTSLTVRAGTVITVDGTAHRFDESLPIILPELVPGADYAVFMRDNVLQASAAGDTADLDDAVGGFHFALGGNALARAGGDEVPAINPFSCWDIGWRPACADARGMTCVDGRFWCDIYLLGMHPFRDGSSRCGVEIADGYDDLPFNEADDTPFEALNYPTSTMIFDLLGKQLLGLEEFFVAAYGVTEGTSIGRDPKITGLDAPRTSKWGVMQATGNMSTWAHNGDADSTLRKCARVGGDWGHGEFAGSRYASVVLWPAVSHGWLGARGRCDHLSLD